MVTRQILFEFIVLVTSSLIAGSCQALSFSSGSSILRNRNNNSGLHVLRSTSRSARLSVDEDSVITKKVVEVDDEEADELVDSVTEKLEAMEGLWYSDDFYGPHGREWVKVSAQLLVGEAATSILVAVKVTGDPNVPAGCETFKTSSWPGSMGGTVPAKIQIRADPNDPNGFDWIPGQLTLVSNDQIRLMCQYSVLMRSTGTFYKQNDQEGDGDGRG